MPHVRPVTTYPIELVPHTLMLGTTAATWMLPVTTTIISRVLVTDPASATH